MFKNKTTQQLVHPVSRIFLAVLMLMVSPLALADWKSLIQNYASDIQVGLYALAAVCALITLTYVGIKWLLARANNNNETTIMDYFKQIAAVAVVGATVLIGTAAWQFFGGTGL